MQSTMKTEIVTLFRYSNEHWSSTADKESAAGNAGTGVYTQKYVLLTLALLCTKKCLLFHRDHSCEPESLFYKLDKVASAILFLYHFFCRKSEIVLKL